MARSDCCSWLPLSLVLAVMALPPAFCVSDPPTPTLHSPPGLTLADGTEFEDLSPEDRPSCVSLTAPTLLSIVNVLTGNVIVSNTSSLVVSWPRNFVVNASLAGKYGCDADGILSNSSFILRVVVPLKFSGHANLTDRAVYPGKKRYFETCCFTGYPSINVTWSISANSSSIQFSDNVTSSTDGLDTYCSTISFLASSVLSPSTPVFELDCTATYESVPCSPVISGPLVSCQDLLRRSLSSDIVTISAKAIQVDLMVSGLEPLTPDRYSAFVVDGESTAPLLTGYLPRCVSVGAETLELVHRSTDGRMTVLVSLRSNLANKTRRSITFPSTVSTFTANLTGSFFCNASVGRFPDVSSSRQYDLYIQTILSLSSSQSSIVTNEGSSFSATCCAAGTEGATLKFQSTYPAFDQDPTMGPETANVLVVAPANFDLGVREFCRSVTINRTAPCTTESVLCTASYQGLINLCSMPSAGFGHLHCSGNASTVTQTFSLSADCGSSSTTIPGSSSTTIPAPTTIPTASSPTPQSPDTAASSTQVINAVEDSAVLIACASTQLVQSTFGASQEAVHWFGPNSVTRVASGSSFLSLPAVKMADAGLYWCSSTSSISGGDVILSAVDLQVSSSGVDTRIIALGVVGGVAFLLLVALVVLLIIACHRRMSSQPGSLVFGNSGATNQTRRGGRWPSHRTPPPVTPRSDRQAFNFFSSDDGGKNRQGPADTYYIVADEVNSNKTGSTGTSTRNDTYYITADDTRPRTTSAVPPPPAGSYMDLRPYVQVLGEDTSSVTTSAGYVTGHALPTMDHSRDIKESGLERTPTPSLKSKRRSSADTCSSSGTTATPDTRACNMLKPPGRDDDVSTTSEYMDVSSVDEEEKRLSTSQLENLSIVTPRSPMPKPRSRTRTLDSVVGHTSAELPLERVSDKTIETSALEPVRRNSDRPLPATHSLDQEDADTLYEELRSLPVADTNPGIYAVADQPDSLELYTDLGTGQT